jgi:hypothetical protein
MCPQIQYAQASLWGKISHCFISVIFQFTLYFFRLLFWTINPLNPQQRKVPSKHIIQYLKRITMDDNIKYFIHAISIPDCQEFWFHGCKKKLGG